ncbi:GTP-binding protein [Mycena metata]|uniref:GTP-binding protein n=1 Tax=Mycena metata TaxID=1033252 RepID=A0AAD7MU94_9AGAR|nr:GTP-binding protein [Mycena metata]
MRAETSNCTELVRKTASAFGDQKLRQLFESVVVLDSELVEAIKLRRKCQHFRILVIGRANAGKTTLLKKVCDSVEEPEIYSPSGKKVPILISCIYGLTLLTQRGEHDINNQLIFKSNRQFIFHDSRGFESGSGDELHQVKTFIASRAGAGKLSEQLHTIWYCLPTDTNRPLLATDEHFFNTSATGKVPVVSIFTKFDGLLTEAVSHLVDEGYSWEEAEEGQIDQAMQMLTNNFTKPLMSSKFPPTNLVRLDDMRSETSDCSELIEKTFNALSDNTLKMLFVSVQQNNINLCIRQAMRE